MPQVNKLYGLARFDPEDPERVEVDDQILSKWQSKYAVSVMGTTLGVVLTDEKLHMTRFEAEKHSQEICDAFNVQLQQNHVLLPESMLQFEVQGG